MHCLSVDNEGPLTAAKEEKKTPTVTAIIIIIIYMKTAHVIRRCE